MSTNYNLYRVAFSLILCCFLFSSCNTSSPVSNSSNFETSNYKFENVIDSDREYRVVVTETGDVYHWISECVKFSSDYTLYNPNTVDLSPKKIDDLEDIVSISLSDGIALAVDRDGKVYKWNYISSNPEIRYDVENPEELSTVQEANFAVPYTYKGVKFRPIEFGGDEGAEYTEMLKCIIVVKKDGSVWMADITRKNELSKVAIKGYKSEAIEYLCGDIAISAKGRVFRFRNKSSSELYLEEVVIGRFNNKTLSKTYYNDNQSQIELGETINEAVYAIDIGGTHGMIIFIKNEDYSHDIIELKFDRNGNSIDTYVNEERIKFFGRYRFIDIAGNLYNFGGNDLDSDFNRVDIDASEVMTGYNFIYMTDDLLLANNGDLYERTGGVIENYGQFPTRYRILNDCITKVEVPKIATRHLVDNLPNKMKLNNDGVLDSHHFGAVYSQ